MAMTCSNSTNIRGGWRCEEVHEQEVEHEYPAVLVGGGGLGHAQEGSTSRGRTGTSRSWAELKELDEGNFSVEEPEPPAAGDELEPNHDRPRKVRTPHVCRSSPASPSSLTKAASGLAVTTSSRDVRRACNNLRGTSSARVLQQASSTRTRTTVSSKTVRAVLLFLHVILSLTSHAFAIDCEQNNRLSSIESINMQCDGETPVPWPTGFGDLLALPFGLDIEAAKEFGKGLFKRNFMEVYEASGVTGDGVYRFMPNVRCKGEMKGVHPIGNKGEAWTQAIWNDAQVCSAFSLPFCIVVSRFS